MANSKSQKLFDKYLTKMESLNKDKRVDEIYRAFLNGKNSYLRMSHVESSSFDPSWIKVIEDCLFDLGEIVNNPRGITKNESSVVPVELAKKIDGESVIHLASHTQYIKEINDKGDVIPSKILSHYNEDSIHTYENRFIATFIRRLVLFIEKRYQFVLNAFPLYQQEVLIMKNTSEVNGQVVEIETKVRIRKESDDDASLLAKDYLERIKSMREYITYYYNSPFMKQMKNERDVRKPILQTNIIRKNPLYRKCFETFTFIERFDQLGVDYKVNEQYSLFSKEEMEQYNYLLLSQYLSMQDEKLMKDVKTNNKVYKPKVHTSIDDEKFVFSPSLYKGPIEFVRVDENYRQYLESQIRQDLPQHPNKQEREFYADEYENKKKIKEQLKELDKLLARKYKDLAAFEKEVEKIIAKRELEDKQAEDKRLEEIRKEEDRRIEEKRQQIIAAAKAKEAERLAKEKEEKERRKAEEAERKRLEAEEKARLEEEERLRKLEEERKAAEEKARQEELARQAEEEARLEAERLAQEEAEKAAQEENIQEEPIIEEQPQEDISEPEPVVEETPIEEPIEEAPNEEPAPEPVQEEPMEEKPEEGEPTDKEPEVVEEPQEEPVQEEKNEPEQEPEPIPEPVEETKEEEPVKESEPIEQPLEEEKAPEEEKPAPVKKEKTKKKPQKKAKKPAKVEDSPKKEEKENKPKPKAEKEPDILEVIPGKFIVKAFDGYYINDKKFSVYKKDATIFDDFNKARQIKAKFGGKVIKL